MANVTEKKTHQNTPCSSLAELIGKGKLQHAPYKNNENYNIVANVSLYFHSYFIQVFQSTMSLYLHLGLSQSLPIPNVALPSPRLYPSRYQPLMSLPSRLYPSHYQSQMLLDLHPGLSQSLAIPNVTLPSSRRYPIRCQSLMSLYLHPDFITVVTNP